jgi:UDP-N-acetyl-D-mannosaminuronate dehydrogenase
VSTTYEYLQGKIISKNAVIAILGQGSGAMRSAQQLSSQGFQLLWFDLTQKSRERDEAQVEANAFCQSEDWEKVLSGILCTDDPQRLSAAEIIILNFPCVLTSSSTPDVTSLMNAVRIVTNQLRPGQMVIVTDPPYPGVTTLEIEPTLNKSNLVPARDYYLVCGPQIAKL